MNDCPRFDPYTADQQKGACSARGRPFVGAAVPANDSEQHIARTLAIERDNGLVNVVVDEPQGIANTIPGVWA